MKITQLLSKITLELWRSKRIVKVLQNAHFCPNGRTQFENLDPLYFSRSSPNRNFKFSELTDSSILNLFSSNYLTIRLLSSILVNYNHPDLTFSMPSTMSSNSVSSVVGDSVINRGIPRKCVCGAALRMYTSATTDNPGRPFYRCETKLKKEHLFKWVEEAVLEEVEDLLVKNGALATEAIDLRRNFESMMFEVKGLNKQITEVHKDLQVLKVVVAVCVSVGLMFMGFSKLV